MFSFEKKNKKPDFEKLYEEVKLKYGEEISNDRKLEISDIIEKNGYYTSSFEDANFSCSEILFALDEKIKLAKKEEQDWFDIKIINLSALSGMEQWLKQLVILPSNTVIYLMPFSLRDFDCSYFLKGYDVDKNLKDGNFDFTLKEQIQLFIYLAKRAGHFVVYDFLTKFSRFSQIVLDKPYLVRWIDTKLAQEKVAVILDDVARELEKDFDKEDVEIIKGIYNQESKGCLSEEYSKIYKIFEDKVLDKKKQLSNEMYRMDNQIKLQKRVRGKDSQTLIEEGLWTVPCGADCEFGLPIFDYMNKVENYPVFKHFDENGNDVSQNVSDDFQTPVYYMSLENRKINQKALKYLVEVARDFVKDFGFDGLKINYTAGVFRDNFNDIIPVSFLKELVVEIKKNNLVLIADSSDIEQLRQYQEVGFDIVWGCFESLTPGELLSKYEKLANYNTENLKIKNLLMTKIYNDKYGESSFVNQYPAQKGFDGAIFEWFCLNFLPSGRNAKMPIVYLDGDESFTQKGFMKTLFERAEFKRNSDEKFYKKFNAINRFAAKSKLVRSGEATIIVEDDEGFSSWLISKEPLKEMILVVSNYGSTLVSEKRITIPGEYRVDGEYVFNGDEFVKQEKSLAGNLLEVSSLNPFEFKIYLLRK